MKAGDDALDYPPYGDHDVYEDIRLERQRQDGIHGGPAHDDTHTAEEWRTLRENYERYAAFAPQVADRIVFEPETRRASLVKIAALAVAQIEALDRGARQ